MEKLILFLIVFGIGSFYEYLKQKKTQGADASTPSSPKPKAVARVKRTEARHRPQQAPVTPPEVIPLKTVKTVKTAKAEAPEKLPIRTQLPDEGGSIFNDIQSQKQEAAAFAPAQPQKRDEELLRHYARWRQAIIDGEIMQRKF